MQEFQSDILKDATIDNIGFCINGIKINSGEYSEEQKRAFITELKNALYSNYADLENIDLSNIELDEKTLKDIFRIAGTANIEVNPNSSFYEFLQGESSLSDTCKERLGIDVDATNLMVYKTLIELKRNSFRDAIIPAKDLIKINDYVGLQLATFYNISIKDAEDIKAFEELRGIIEARKQRIFIKDGIQIDTTGLDGFRITEGVKEGSISLSKEEELFHTRHTTNEKYRRDKPKTTLDTEEIILSIMQNRCVPARTLNMIGEEILEDVTKISLSVQTEEDRSVLEEYKEQALQGKTVTLASSTIAQMQPKLLDGLTIERVMVGIDENENGKYDVETYKTIYDKVTEITRDINEGSDYDKFQKVYERLSKILKYDYKSWEGSKEFDEEHRRQTGHNVILDPSIDRDVSRVSNLEAFLYDGESVCEGFAEVLRQTLSMVGIKSDVIYGDVEDGAHAWNRVKLDGKLYNCDLTWDKNLVSNCGIYKKSRPRRVLRNNPNLSKKIMPHYYLKSDREFGKDHTPFNKPEGEALEDFDADSYYSKDFKAFLKEIFGNISTRLCRTAEVIMNHDVEEWERGRNLKKEEAKDDRSL